MPKKPLIGKAASHLLARFSLSLVAAGCAVAGCVFLPHGTPAPGVAPTVEPLKAAIQVAESSDVPLKLVCTSVELDLSVKVCDEQDQVITGQPFELTVTPSEGDALKATDDDQDGIISVDELPAGDCTIALTALEGFTVPQPATFAIAPKVNVADIDLTDKIVDSSQIDAANDDAQFDRPGGADNSSNGPQESVDVAPDPTPEPTPTPTPEPEPTPTPTPEPTPTPAWEGYSWRSDGEHIYYMTYDGNKLTGLQNIEGTAYHFNSAGVLQGQVGIDVSTWQGSINWQKVRDSGVTFAIIRLGFRGYGTGKLVLDDCYISNIKGALAAGLKVGVYFFTEAINTTEAAEEAKMCLEYVRGYSISYPIAIDTEYIYDDARANNLTVEQRTKICATFCQVIRDAGYTPAIYASCSWLNRQLDMSQLSSYMTWLAQYATVPDYGGSYGIWQYTSDGSINGISGRVDLNISYLESAPEALPLESIAVESLDDAQLPSAQSENGDEAPAA